NEGEARLLDTTIGHTVSLLLVSPDHAESELEGSVERLFDEGGSGNQTKLVDFAGGEQDANIQPVVEAADTAIENMAPVQSRRQGKIKYAVVDAGGASHPPKKLRKDHGIPSGTYVGDSLHHSGTNVAEAEVDSLVRSFVSIMTTITTIISTVDPTSVAKEKLIEPYSFGAGSSLAGGTDPTTGVFSDLTGSDFLVGAIRTIINPDTDLQKVYVPHWSLTNGSRFDDGRVCREMVDEFAPPKFFASVRGMEHDQLFTKFNVGDARQISLRAENETQRDLKVENGLYKSDVDLIDGMKQKIIGEINSTLDNIVEKLSQDDLEMLSGMEGDLPTMVKDDDDNISEIEVYVEADVSLVEQHMREVMSGKRKDVVIKEIVEDDGLDEQHMRNCSNGEKLGLTNSDGELLIDTLWFDDEDLESLWNIVKERFSTSKPNNFSDDFLLTTLRVMFGRPDGQDQVWMSQRSVHGQARVKSWKLLESCGVHIVALTNTQLIMLVERRYPLSSAAEKNDAAKSSKDYFHTCMFACFLSQEEPKRVHQALKDPSWIEAMQEELLQFKMQKVLILVDLPHGKRAIGTKWVYRNKKDERGTLVRNKARLVAQGEVYVCQPSGFEDPDYPEKVYKVVKALYGLYQAPRAWYETLTTYLLKNGFHRGKIDQTLFIKKQKRDILFVQIYVDDIIFDKYVAEILKKFGLTEGKSASTPTDTEKPLLRDPDGEDVDVYIYRSMIGSLMYLTSSRPDIMFVVCACARFQVTPKVSHLHAVKRIFRYLKGKLNLGLWYPKDSPFDLVNYLDSDYAGVSLDRKSTIGGCQFLGSRLIYWQWKKETVIATSSTEAKYVAGASCYAQVLWIQNQMLDYGRGLKKGGGRGVVVVKPNVILGIAVA
nr:hypothetical protein [Tanacetum cinerariifolium]